MLEKIIWTEHQGSDVHGEPKPIYFLNDVHKGNASEKCTIPLGRLFYNAENETWYFSTYINMDMNEAKRHAFNLDLENLDDINKAKRKAEQIVIKDLQRQHSVIDEIIQKLNELAEEED